jgi:pyridoxine 5-phosphate synthase
LLEPCGPVAKPVTKLSVNLNKVALLRNSRGRDYPSVREFGVRCLDCGAHGITLHPRPDQRHARYSDIQELKIVCDERQAELNVEGYPSPEFMAAVVSARPTQVTLVPDSPGQLTSDHGWKIREEAPLLRRALQQLRDHGIRSSLFIDYDCPEIGAAREVGSDRIELYTEPFAAAFDSVRCSEVLAAFRQAALNAQKVGLGINGGHDLNLKNLESFLSIPRVLEVSIGHALIVECLELGLPSVIAKYLEVMERAEADPRR